MIINPQVKLHRLILSLSEALDYVHPQIVDHQQRVAHIATNLARHLGLRRTDLLEVFNAAALHDIGLIGADNRLRAIHLGQLEELRWHCEMGFNLLNHNPLFTEAANIIRWHHIRWDDPQPPNANGQTIPLACHIITLADEADRLIDRAVPILQQNRSITDSLVSRSGTEFHPDCVDAFRAVSSHEAFWLDTVSPRIYSVLLKQMDWPVLTIDEGALEPIAKVFGQIVDAASPWTMVHTAGVTATAAALAQMLNFAPRELQLMRAAGYLHDLGKLSVSNEILDKPDKLTDQEMASVKGHTYHTFRILDTIGGMPQISEWAAFHHERLDGKGYPFRHHGKDLTLGSRIMAVADVFTAITEDRPYRKAMPSQRALSVLDNFVKNGALDGNIVTVLKRNFDAINDTRSAEQATYAQEQQQLALTEQEPAIPMAT